MRFADPVRGAGSPRDALVKLIARGEVSIPNDAIDDTDEDQTDANVAAIRDEPPAGVEYVAPHSETPNDDSDDDSDESPDQDSPDHGSTDDEYVFDRDADEDDADEAAASEERGAAFDDFDVDFEEPVNKAVSPAAPEASESTAQRPKKTPRKPRKAESVHPTPAGDSSISSSHQDPEFDEFD